MVLIGTGAIFSSCPHFYPSVSWSGFIVRGSDLFERHPPPTISPCLDPLLWPSSTHSFNVSAGSEVLDSADCKSWQQGPRPWEKCPCSEPWDRETERERERERHRGYWWQKNSRLFRLQKNGPITPAWKRRQGQEWNKDWNTLQDFCTIIFLNLQSRRSNNAKCRKTVSVWRSKLTDSTEKNEKIQKWKYSREFVAFVDKDMTVNWTMFALRMHTHVSQRLTGQAFTLMH